MEMAESTDSELSEEEKLKLSLCYQISKMCDEVCDSNTLLGKLSIDKAAKKLISELIYKKLLVYGRDLESFANHAKRTTVNPDDVKLLFRRNETLVQHLSTVIQNIGNTKETKKSRVSKKDAKPEEGEKS